MNEQSNEGGQTSGDSPAGNPRPAQSPAFNLPGSVVSLIALCVVIHVIRANFITPLADLWVVSNWAFTPISYTPEFLTLDLSLLFSPFTYAFLHGDWVHLAINMIWFAAFGAPLAFRLGLARTLWLWLITSIGAVLLHLALYWGDPVPLIGASGAVSGFMGAAARFGFRANRRVPRAGFSGPRLGILQCLQIPGVLSFLLVWLVINYVAGADPFGLSSGPSIAWEAHIGGLLTGFFAIGLIDRR